MHSLITDLVKSGKARLALDLYYQHAAKQQPPPPPLPIPVLLALLQACAQLKDLQTGRHIHAHIARNGAASLDRCQDDAFLGNKLVDMYAKCGSLPRSLLVFDMLRIRDVVAWNTLMSAYTSHGLHHQVLFSLESMRLEGVSPNPVTFVYLLKACNGIGDAEKGSGIHSEIARLGLLEKDLVLGNTAMDMYAKFGFLSRAREVFDVLQVQDVVSWTILIAGYVDCKRGREALELLNRMQLEGIYPNEHTFVCGLKACSSTGAKYKGQAMHAMIATECIVEQNIVLGNALIDMYGKCGVLDRAQEVFNGLQAKDMVSWNALIAGYAQHGHGREALDRLREMVHKGALSPDVFTYASGLQACTSTGDVQNGMELHDEIIKKGLLELEDVLLSNVLVDMYGKSGLLADARQVFDHVPFRNVVSWTALMDGYTRNSDAEETLKCFELMSFEGFSPNAVTYVCVLKACAMARDAEMGARIHADVKRKGFLASDIEVGNALIEMYIECGLLIDAKEVLFELPVRNTISWNAIIIGYVAQELNDEAFESLSEMQIDGVVPNAVTFAYALKACGNSGCIEKGRALHAVVVAQEGLLERYLILGTLLVYLYTRCGQVSEALEVVNKLSIRNAASWTAVIAGYTEYDQAEDALRCFDVMQSDGASPSAIMYSSILKACSNTGNIGKGSEIHAEIARKGMLEEGPILGNALVDMYTKCGSLSWAKEAFDKLLARDVVSWNILISAYTMHEMVEQALMCFEQMQHERLHPSTSTYVSILKACGIGSCIERGKAMHGEITRKGLSKTGDFVGNVLVDMYARCGSLVEARAVFDKLQVRDVVAWTTLISGHIECGACEEALDLYRRMQMEGVCPNSVTYMCILKACGGSSRSLGKIGIETCATIDQALLLNDIALGNSVMEAYVRCGSMARAREAFDGCQVRDQVTWNIVTTGYASHGCDAELLVDFYCRMQCEGLVPTFTILVCNLKACTTSMRAIHWGKQLHVEAIENRRLESDASVGNALIGMYMRHGFLPEARNVFDALLVRDRPAWTALISGCMKNRLLDGAMDLCEYMLIEGVCSMSDCTASRNRATDSGELAMVSSLLVEVYTGCGLLDRAQKVLDKLYGRDVVIWTLLTAGYTRHGRLEEALDCYYQMQADGISPDTVSFLCGLKACKSIGVSDRGSEMHADLIRAGISDIELVMGNVLVDMYARCGQVCRAVEVFDRLPVRDVVSWTSLIVGYLRTGESQQVFCTFERMRSDGVKPDIVAFSTVLAACCRANLLQSGLSFFEAMDRDFGISPVLQHCTSIVDLLVQSGDFASAVMFMQQMMPMSPDASLSNAVMSACLKSGNLELGRKVFRRGIRAVLDHDLT